MASNLIPFLLGMYILLALISALGKDFIVELAWRIYINLPLPIRSRISRQKTLQSEHLRTSADLRSTSSQDEFAKWARLNRQHDKQIEDLKKLSSSIDNHRAMFQRVVRTGVWIGTMGVKGVVQWRYGKEPVFWLPAGTFPVWVEFIVAFPRAPRGSVSTMMFGLCATRVIGFTISFAKDVINASRREERASKSRAVSEGGDGSGVNASTGKEKIT